MYLVLCVIVVIVLGTLIRGYLTGGKEHFDMLLTTNPVTFVSRYNVDETPRHVLFNKSGGIMYISMNEPVNAHQIKCPEFIDESVTLGRNNYCYLNKI